MFAHKCLLILLHVTLHFSNSFGQDNNVCYTWLDYYIKMIPFTSPNCTYNKDVVLSLPEIAKKYNNPVEIVNVTTADGYQLQLFHIKKPGPTVVIIHGIFQNSLGWFLQGNTSLPIVLANKDYDVWVVNLRGTVYSKGHVNATIQNSPDLFWDFSLHEMGVYDLPAIFQYIYENNGNKKMVGLSFSMGSTALTIYCAMNPDDADKYLKQVVEMAPVVYLSHMKGILSPLSLLWPIAKYIVKNKVNVKPDLGGNPNVFIMEFYKYGMGMVFGLDPDQYNPINLPIIMKRNGDLIAVNVISHYVQIKCTGKFEALKGSTTYNQKHYINGSVPRYNLSMIRVPIMFIHGENDAIANPEDVTSAFDQITQAPKTLIKLAYKLFNHNDFISAKDAITMLYTPLADKWINQN